MTLQAITMATHPALPFITNLYELAFPLNERRSTEQLVSMVSGTPMNLELILDGKDHIGFVITWQLDNWQYIEHLAIDPLQRGKRYGSAIIALLMKRSGGRIILEAEPAIDDTALRRIQFYTRLGFSIIPFAYQQPPYREKEEPVPMHLLSLSACTEKESFEWIAKTIRTTVYEPWY